MANPFPFSSGAVLTAAQLNGIGEWTSFTPTFNNVSLGASGTVAGKYAQVNDLVFWQASFDLNGTGSVSGHINMNLPVGTCPVSITYPTSATGWVQPTGSTIYQIMGTPAAGVIWFYGNRADTAYSQIASLVAAVPVTWDANGEFYATGWYELA